MNVDYSLRSKKMKGWRMRGGSYVASGGRSSVVFYIWKAFVCYKIWREEERDWFTVEKRPFGSRVLKNAGN